MLVSRLLLGITVHSSAVVGQRLYGIDKYMKDATLPHPSHSATSAAQGPDAAGQHNPGPHWFLDSLEITFTTYHGNIIIPENRQYSIESVVEVETQPATSWNTYHFP
ncbi:hypothetical protein AFLA_004807 [Aspergillus flavus NRRL3357]|nr:hypothetical protein AFLA_004807 [Aspergillus flavus NRRL3357]